MAAIAEAAPFSLNLAGPTVNGVVRLDPKRTRLRGSSVKMDIHGTMDDHCSAHSANQDDPLRILAPAQKKLTTIESQRVVSVVDETMKRLEGVLLLPALLESLDRFSVSLGSELVTLLEDYHRLVEEYKRLEASLEAQGIEPKVEGSMSTVEGSSARMLEATYSSGHNIVKLGGIGERSPTGSASSLHSDASLTPAKPRRLEPIASSQLILDEEATEEKFQELRIRLRHVVRCILRALSKNPSTASILQVLAAERSKTSNRLVKTVTELRGAVHEKLLTTQVEMVNRDEHLKKVAERQKLAEEQIKRLEAELSEAQQKKNEEVEQKNTEIKRLKSNIKALINLADDANRRVKANAHNQEMSDKKNHEARATKMVEDIAALKKRLTELVAGNKEKEQTLRKRAFRRETELENWIQKYDREMGEKQDELEQLETEFTDETTELKELEEKLVILTIEYDAVIKEQEEARQRAEEAARKMSEMLRAARIIQKVWRKYCERKRELKEQQKGKKGKGKGNGKGKGKKGKKR